MCVCVCVLVLCVSGLINDSRLYRKRDLEHVYDQSPRRRHTFFVRMSSRRWRTNNTIINLRLRGNAIINKRLCLHDYYFVMFIFKS